MDSGWLAQTISTKMPTKIQNAELKLKSLLVSGVNCSIDDMPDRLYNRTDVTTVGWDGNSTYYEIIIQ